MTDLLDLAARVEQYDPATSPDNRADELDLHQSVVLATGVGSMNPAFEATFLCSLDVAMTLGSGSGRSIANLLFEAMLRLQSMPLHLLAAVEYREYLARFVTAAALRARATQGDTSYEDE